MKPANPGWSTVIAPLVARIKNQSNRWLVLSGSLAVLDYGLVSLSKFGVSVYLGRYTGQAEFGLFVLAFSLLTFFNGFQIGLVGESITVLTAPLKDRTLARYLTTATIIVSALAVSLGLITTGISAGLKPYVRDIDLAPFFTLGWVTIPFLLQDYFRRVLFSKHKSAMVLVNDLLLIALQILGLGWLHFTHSLSANHALIVIGASALISALLGLLQSIRMASTPWSFFQPDYKALQEIWNYGRWALGAQITYNASTQGYVYAAGLMLSPVAAGALKACQNLVSPVQIFLLGMDSFLIAVGSHRFHEKGLQALERLLRIIGILVVGFTLPYVILVSLFAEQILNWAYNGKYNGYGAIVILYAVFYLAFAAARPFVLGLRSIKKPAWIFQGYLISTIVMAISIYPSITHFGAVGAALGNSITELVFLIVVMAAFLTIRRKFAPMPGSPV